MDFLSAYHLLLLAHVLLFAYWLGADVAVFFGARYSADSRYSVETRTTVAEITGFVDLFPRLAVPLTGATGFALATQRGTVDASAGLSAAVYAVTLTWFANNLYIYLNRKRPERLGLPRNLDLTLRCIAGAGALLLGVNAFVDASLVADRSIGAKLIVFAAAIAFSLTLRFVFAPYRPALRKIAEGDGGPEDEAAMKRALAIGRPVVVGIWLCTIVAAAIGLWHPF